jgi:hypothetical protein
MNASWALPSLLRRAWCLLSLLGRVGSEGATRRLPADLHVEVFFAAEGGQRL